jgi:hypothetical protein
MARRALMRVTLMVRLVQRVVEAAEGDVELVGVVDVVDVVVGPRRLGVRLSRILLRRGRGKRPIRGVGRIIIVDNSMRRRWRVGVECLAKSRDRCDPCGCML